MKPLLSRILICLLPVVLACGVVGWAFYQYSRGEGGFRLGIDLVGGTILVYEVDESKQKNIDAGQAGGQKLDLAAALKRRIDPADLYNITIRNVPATPGSPPRVEIILPTGGRHQADIEEKRWNDLLAAVRDKYPNEKGYDDIPTGAKAALIGRIMEGVKVSAEESGKKYEEVSGFVNAHYQTGKGKRNFTSEQIEAIKELISRQGRLEFRILANPADDFEAIKAAQDWIKANPDQLARLATSGEPPPPPRNAGGGTTFDVILNGQTYPHTYSWVEVGKEELYTLGLNNDAAKPTNPKHFHWQQAAAARTEGKADFIGLGGEQTSTFLLYSRKITNLDRLTPKDRELGKQYEYFMLVRDPEKGTEVTGDYLAGVKPDVSNEGKTAVAFNFTPEGGNRFYELTNRNKRRHLAVILDAQIRSAPVVQSAIRDRGQISGEFTPAEQEALVTILRAGALPATLKQNPVSENTIGATLGDDTIRSGTFAVVIAFVAVLLFMLVYYRFAGMVACIALLANLVLTVAFMVLVNATFTLPGLAGLVLMLGMAVDANVLIYERLREERERGASLALAIRNGYDHAFPTIIDTHLSSIFTAIVLYVVGNDQLKGFGISLTVGLIISLFTSLYMTRTMFDYCLAKGWLTKLTMMQLFKRPNIDFMAIRYYWFAATIILTIVGGALFVWRLDKGGLNIDFVGGTKFSGQLNEMESIAQLRTDFDGIDKPKTVRNEATGQEETLPGLPDVSIEPTFSSSPELSQGNSSKLFTIRTSEKNADLVQRRVAAQLGDKMQRLLVSQATLAYVVRLNQAATPEEVGKALEGGPLAGAEVRPAPAAPEAPHRLVVWSPLAPEETRKALGEALKDNLKALEPNAAQAQFTFVDAKTQQEDYASKGQVTLILSRELEPSGVKQFNLTGVGKQQGGRYKKMRLELGDPMPAEALYTTVANTKQDFASRPQPESLENFDAQLATKTQTTAMYAILASWAAILLYLWFRFGNWTFGTAAVLCLIHDLFFTLGIIAGAHYIHGTWFGNLLGIHQDFKIDLPSIAALLTLVGYSVNDTIVVFDRIREVRGKNPALTPQMINDSVNQTLSRTVLASLSVWLVVFVLYVFGGEGVHLFAFVMVVGVIVGTYSSIYIASPLLLIFGEGSGAPAPAEKPAPTPAPAPAGGTGITRGPNPGISEGPRG
jgi:SecD/SecF fusion protein